MKKADHKVINPDVPGWRAQRATRARPVVSRELQALAIGLCLGGFMGLIVGLLLGVAL